MMLYFIGIFNHKIVLYIDRHQSTKHSLMKSLSSGSFRSLPSQNNLQHNENNSGVTDPAKEKLLDHEKGKLEFVKVDVDNKVGFIPSHMISM